MKKQNIRSKYSLTRACLDILFGVGEAISWNNKKAWRRALGAPDIPDWRLNRAMAYLEKRGEVKKRKAQKEEFFKLTEKGRLRVLLQKMNAPATDQKWDGKWWVIMWDIPESDRHFRDYFRKWIKSFEFYQLQKSVFIRPYHLPEVAIQYLKELGIKKYIRILRVDHLEDDLELRKHFGLKYGKF